MKNMQSINNRKFTFFICKSSHQRCSMKKGVLSKFTKLTRKHLARVSFLTKLQALKKRLWHRCLPANFVKCLSNARLKLTKSQANAKQHPEAELQLFGNYSQSSTTSSSKNNRTYSKK